MLEGVKKQRILLDSGLEIAVLDWGGAGPLALLHHATGVCAAAWDTIATRLTGLHVVAFDARGHGDSSKPDEPYTWSIYARDLTEISARLCAEFGSERVEVAVGHSLGGIAIYLSQLERPELYGRGVLLEPAFISTAMEEAAPRRRDGTKVNALATRLRRARFPTREEARVELERQPNYGGWDEHTLDVFVAEGISSLPAGGFELKCPPEIEAAIYDLGPEPVVWEPGGPRIPLRVVTGRTSHFLEAHEEWARLHPEVEHVLLDGSHVVPMERPKEVAHVVLREE